MLLSIAILDNTYVNIAIANDSHVKDMLTYCIYCYAFKNHHVINSVILNIIIISTTIIYIYIITYS